jgi:hypothetical protein
VPSLPALQEAVALLTSAAGADDELDTLVHRALDEQPAPDMLLAVLALGRELCFTASRLIHLIDDDLSNADVYGLTDEELRPAVLSVLQGYGQQIASGNRPPS